MGNKSISDTEKDTSSNKLDILPKINICMAAYNEAAALQSTFSFLEKSLKNLNFESVPQITICLNGCNDNTEETLLEIKRKYSFPIKILHSERGKLKAHKKIILDIKNNHPILFLDADILVPQNTIRDLISELKKNKRLCIVSAYPYVQKQKDLPIYQNLMYNILNIRRICPKIEVSKEDVSRFHPGALDKYEKRSRIYFHGRCFLIRNKSTYKFPRGNSNIRGDDTFLSFITLKEKPPGSIKVLYDSPVYSYPTLSLSEHLRTWYRIRKDLDHIYKEYPEFNELKSKTQTKPNWPHIIKELPASYKIYSLLFFVLKKFESISYKLIRNRIDIDTIWSYNKKNSFDSRRK